MAVPAPTIVTARWVLPVAGPPLAHGWVEVHGGRVVRVGSGPPPTAAVDLGDVALLPGLVNAHTHLELSGLAGRIPPAETFVDWVRAVLARRAAPDAEAMAAAAAAMRATGTVLVGDITNTLASPPVLGRAGLAGVVFHELLGFATAEHDAGPRVHEAWDRVDRAVAEASGPGAMLRAGLAAHAPYSTSPALVRAIARHRREAPLSIHLGESVEEIEFLRTGTGPFRNLLEDLGVWQPDWRPPGCDPAAYLDQLGYLQGGTLVVHGVHLTPPALERLREQEAVLVSCPRSNLYVGAGLPRLAHAVAAGVPVAVGTDSLASTTSLSLFDELAELRRIAPEVTAASLLESATRVGATALGFARDFGTIEPGRLARWAAVEVDPQTSGHDVEEYLVSGVPEASVRPVAYS